MIYLFMASIFYYFRLEQTKLVYKEALAEKLKILLMTSCLIELLLDCFEVQFNRTVFIFHTLK